MIVELASLVLMLILGMLAGVVLEHRLYNHRIKRITFQMIQRQQAAAAMTPDDVARGITHLGSIGERVRAAHQEHVASIEEHV